MIRLSWQLFRRDRRCLSVQRSSLFLAKTKCEQESTFGNKHTMKSPLYSKVVVQRDNTSLYQDFDLIKICDLIMLPPNMCNLLCFVCTWFEISDQRVPSLLSLLSTLPRIPIRSASPPLPLHTASTSRSPPTPSVRKSHHQRAAPMSPDEKQRDAANACVRRWEDRALALKARQDAAEYEQEKAELFREMVRVLEYWYCFELMPLAVARIRRFEARPQPPPHHYQLHGRDVPR